MKNSLLLIFLLFPLIGFSQFIVSDPVLAAYAAEEAASRQLQTANTLKTLGEAYKHTTELTKTASFLKKNYDRLNEVNTFITNLARLENLITRQKRLIEDTKEVVEEMNLSTLYTFEEINSLHYTFTKMITTTNDIVDMLDLILKPKTKMSDGERMMLLHQMEDDFKERQALMNKTLFEYRQVRNQRLVNHALTQMRKKEKK